MNVIQTVIIDAVVFIIVVVDSEASLTRCCATFIAASNDYFGNCMFMYILYTMYIICIYLYTFYIDIYIYI